ncbi:hypothetical protein [Spirosoma rhododendri]|uniref:Uncharacterized protein n=1 Tax=Spirosoma rhododendri TaxID=2728024 RepID=A0A7L5DMQ4_9BACT|nr:hypothetical protein [Spirosoma rhododendri]QJD79395.1 hypothetical protein HH216_13970 [Spirosoma rhododendri]
MTNSFTIKSASDFKGQLYKFFTLAARRINVFAVRNKAIFEGVARTAVPFGGNVLNSRF